MHIVTIRKVQKTELTLVRVSGKLKMKSFLCLENHLNIKITVKYQQLNLFARKYKNVFLSHKGLTVL